jgi:hypothetical protein
VGWVVLCVFVPRCKGSTGCATRSCMVCLFTLHVGMKGSGASAGLLAFLLGQGAADSTCCRARVSGSTTGKLAQPGFASALWPVAGRNVVELWN